MTSARTSPAQSITVNTLQTWIDRSLEAMWLLAAVLVPLAALSPDYILSEAVVAFVEVPKIAVLRTLAGLMAMAWILEWGLGKRNPSAAPDQIQPSKAALAGRWAQLKCWLRESPARWVVVSVWFFLGSTLISTALSASFQVSLWGEVPGQDSFAAYTIIAYAVIFGVVATHLRTRRQLWRLTAAIIATGVAVAGYAALQYFGHDFLGLAEPTGGGTDRVTATMGNALFSGAFIFLTIPVSVTAATITLLNPLEPRDGRPGGTSQRLRALAVATVWALAIAVQLLGLTFTYSRGSWGGAGLALAAFLGLVALFVGRRELGRAALLMGLSGLLTLALVLWPSPTAFLAIGLFLGLMAVFLFWGPGQASVVLGVMAGLAVAGAAALVWLGKGGDGLGQLPSAPGPSAPSTADAVLDRFASITGEVSGSVVGGSFAERGDIWKASWRIIQQRPWFQFDEMSLGWSRDLTGYGPDLFRYVFLLESLPGQINHLPVEPDHAHNYLIHQTVEQGVLGLLSSLALMVTPILSGGYHLLRHKHDYSSTHKLALAGLVAVFSGRFLEQLVGLARVSDLTILWMLLAIFAALPGLLKSPEPQAAVPLATPRRPPRNRVRANPVPLRRALDWKLCLRLAVVAWVIGSIGAVTWVKTLNYPRAAAAAGQALANLETGRVQASLASLDRATTLAPDVPVYYQYRAFVYTIYRDHSELPPEQGCHTQRDTTYDSCLAQMAYLNNMAAVEQRPFYWRSRLALADAAFILRLDNEAIRLYEETATLVPHSWVLHNRLAAVYMSIGNPQKALDHAELSLAITESSDGARLKQEALKELGKLAQPVATP